MLVEKIIETVKNNRTLRRQRTVYASDIGGCERKITLSLLDMKKTDDVGRDNWLISAELGNVIHNWVQSLILYYYPNAQIEYRVESDDGSVSGRVDAVVDTEEGRIIIDIKTVNSREFRERSKLDQWKDQINVYGTILFAAKGLILLVNRDTGELDEITFDIDYQRAGELIARAGKIVDYAKNGIVGIAEFAGSRYCSLFCPFFSRCEQKPAGRLTVEQWLVEEQN